MDSVSVSNKIEFPEQVSHTLKFTITPGALSIATQVLNEMKVFPWRLIFEMANECEETFKDAMRQFLAETNRITAGPKTEQILEGFALLRGHAMVLQRKKTIRDFQINVLMRPGRIRSTLTTGSPKITTWRFRILGEGVNFGRELTN